MRTVEDIFLILAIVFQLIAVGCLCYTAITNNVRLNKLATLFYHLLRFFSHSAF